MTARPLPRASAPAPLMPPAAAGVIPVFAPRCARCPKITDTGYENPLFSCPVLQKKTDRAHLRRRWRHFRTAIGIAGLFAIACSRPASYEQFVRADETAGGTYVFTIPATIADAAASGEVAPTFDVSIYTAPLKEPLQMEICWLVATSEDLQHFSQKMLQIPLENGGPIAKMPENASDTPQKDSTCSKNAFFCDRSGQRAQIILKENVWFPAGEHRALYRSGVSPASDIILQIKPINPPEGFRGLGIICKRNDGTR